MIEKIDLIEFEKIVLSRDETKALKLLQSKNILLDDKSKNALDRLFRLGLAEKYYTRWKYETFGPDGQCKLFGVNIFDYNWQTTGKRVKVKDPIYHQDHTFEVWQVEIDGQIHRFAAGEFSNCVWGFYLEKN